MEIKIQKNCIILTLLGLEIKNQNTIMKLENFPPRNRDAQTKEIGNLKNIQKERFKSKDKYFE